MANGYTKPLTGLPLFKNYINNDENYKNANDLNNNYLITTKICHHKNVETSDIDNIFMGLNLSPYAKKILDQTTSSWKSFAKSWRLGNSKK